MTTILIKKRCWLNISSLKITELTGIIAKFLPLKQILSNADFLNLILFIILKMQSMIKKIVFILKCMINWRNLQLVVIRFKTFCFAFFFRLRSTLFILPRSCFCLLLVLIKKRCIDVQNVDEH